MGMTIFPPSSSSSGSSSTPAPPEKVFVEMGDKRNTTYPVFPDYLDGCITFESGTSIKRYNASGAEQWEITPSDLDGSDTVFTFLFYISDDHSEIYLASTVTTSSDRIHLATVNILSGVVTNVGTDTGVILNNNAYDYTSNTTSFTYIDGDDIVLVALNDELRINVTTGVLVSSTAIPSIGGESQNGYMTADGSIKIAGTMQGASDDVFRRLALKSASSFCSVNYTYDTQYPSGRYNSSGYTGFYLCGGDVIETMLIGGTGSSLSRIYDRADFDRWLKDMARLGGIIE